MVCCVPPFFVRDDVLLAIGNAYGDVERIESVPTVANVGFIKFRYREDALLCAQTIAANPQFGWSAEIHNKILTQDNNNEPSHPTNNKPIRRNTNNKNHKNNNVNNTNNANSNVNNNNNNNNNNKSSASTNNNNTANGHTANGVDHKTDEVSIIDATDEPVAELSNSEKCQVFVGGIDPAHSNDTAIAALFARCGEVVSIAIKNNSVTDMRRDSFAFVRYKTPAEAETAIRELVRDANAHTASPYNI
jgi:hypothetical protein